MTDRSTQGSDSASVPGTRVAPTTLKLPGHPSTNKAAARKLYGAGLGGMVFGSAVHQRLGQLCSGADLNDGSCNFIEDLLERMAPRDPMEELLVVQAAMAYARVLHLTELANQQESLESIRTVHEYADRASNTYRRLMLALAEYRRPPRVGDSFTAIRQANIAGQQVVQNGEVQGKRNATNEQGSGAREPPQTLPTDPRGAGVPAGRGVPHQAVGAVHRAEDG